ncbi:GbsR/MarR family transcriptional regulator [Tomitella cavernea]|uniref:MarR family transcriptional regulator n=1 Tax=Tomitella cavernea TaxID=1387982 RepID=A0ABP9CNJ7_9ACTN|nr:MarR family transcriptional regulator [Tomitella cavernea]
MSDGRTAAEPAPADDGSPADHPEDAAVAEFVERFASSMTTSGLPRMASRVFATLMAAPSRGLTAAQLKDELGVSAGAVSGAVRWLAQVGFITRSTVTGTRQDLYIAESDSFVNLMLQDIRALRAWRNDLRDGVAALGARSPAGRRMAEALEFFEFLDGELPGMIERWQELRRRRGSAGQDGSDHDGAGTDDEPNA